MTMRMQMLDVRKVLVDRRDRDTGRGLNISRVSVKGPALWIWVMSSLETGVLSHSRTLALHSTTLKR